MNELAFFETPNSIEYQIISQKFFSNEDVLNKVLV